MIEMNIVGVRLELPLNQPIVLLKEKKGKRYLPIWIGTFEAMAIALAMQGVKTPRPMTHDLVRNLFEKLNIQMTKVEITEIKEGTFYALITLSVDGEFRQIDSRPSDAIALAVRTMSPVYADESVLEEAGIVIHSVEEEVGKFRDFLDTVQPEDFGK